MLETFAARRMPIQEVRGSVASRRPGARGRGIVRAAAQRCPAARGALAALGAALVLAPAAGAGGARDVVTNTAIATYTTNGGATATSSNTSTVTVLPPRTPSTIEFLVCSPSSPDAELVSVPECCYSTTGDSAGPFTPSPPPETGGPDGGPIDMLGPVPLIAAAYYHHDESAFVRLTDLDQNADPLTAEAALLTVVGATGETELLRVTEVAPDAGVFVGYLALGLSCSGDPAHDGCLRVGNGDRISAFYEDPADPTDTSTDDVPVDPRGHAFDSTTGNVLDGVEITLLDADTGEPASVLGDDGISAFPASVVTGGRVTDSGGTAYQYGPGEFRFPVVQPGTYRLELEPPDGYTAPSTVPTEALAELQGNHDGPLVLLEPAMRGEPFVIGDRPGFRTDIPIDLIGRSLFVTKAAGRAVVSHGEFVRYEISVATAHAETLGAVSMTDNLPRGFRYRTGSARLDGARTEDPVISSNGRVLVFALGELGRDPVELSYVAEVGAGAPVGTATNTARAAAGGATSNVARADVEVRDDLLRNTAVIVGRVVVRECDDREAAATGVAGVRIYLEDGTSVVTDARGMYHFHGVRPGAHVLALDLESLPEGHEPASCRPNSRFAGREHSRFVDVAGGTTWRTDFELAAAPGAAGEPSSDERGRVSNAEKGPTVADGGAPAQSRTASAGRDGPHRDDHDDLPAWAWPGPDHHPAIPSIKVAVRHAAADTIALFVNGRPVSPRSLEDVRLEDDGTALSRWRGIDLEEGGNSLVAVARDASGSATGQLERTVHYSGPPVHVRLLPEESVLEANGRGAPVVAVLLTDRDGHPARQGVIGSCSVDPPYATLRKADPLAIGPLSGSLADRPSFSVGEDGIARIPLEPTTEAGEVVLRLHLVNGEHEVRTWLTPEERDWILVGLAEGTVGYRVIEANAEPSDASEEDYYHDGRAAFFARGRIRGGWLLTLAYDTEGGATEPGDAPLQTVDPDAYYTLYGDATEQRSDAASAEKLYVRIERDAFYLLFGDYASGLTTTELSRYDRVVTGLKTEFRADHVSLNAFASEASTAFVRDEIPGDGTSGLYRLSRERIVPNTERVVIETRDRFRSEIIVSSRWMVRHIDYDIDATAGTLFFKEPIPSQDEDLNPVFIVAEYESADRSDERWNYGGRGAVRILDRALEVGATHVHEERLGAEADLVGVDATLDIGRRTELRGEFARTSTDTGGGRVEGDAYLAALTHRGGALSGRLYLREHAAAFGLGQQNVTERGTRKLGLDATHRLSERWSVSARAYRQLDLVSDAERRLGEARVNLTGRRHTLSAGLRDVSDELPQTGSRRSTQVTAGGSYRTLGERLLLRVDHEQSVADRNDNPGFPTRTRLGADYRVAKPVTAFAEHEIARGVDEAERSRVGLRATPWTGASVNTSLGSEATESTDRLYANLGLRQALAFGDGWTVDAGLDHGRAFSRGEPAEATSPVLPSSTVAEDFTAASAGVGHRKPRWSWTTRAEYRVCDRDEKWIAALGVHGEPREGLGLSAATRVQRTLPRDAVKTNLGHVRLGLALRPLDSPWTVLDRLDLVLDDRAGDPSSVERKVVNNLSVNYAPGDRFQIAGQHGVKRVWDEVDGVCYRGMVDLVGLELRYDLTERWDVGLHGSALHSGSSGQTDYCLGGSVGVNVLDGAWLTAGYNVAGFVDEDFPDADYTARGPYIKLRFAIDEKTAGGVLDALGMH